MGGLPRPVARKRLTGPFNTEFANLHSGRLVPSSVTTDVARVRTACSKQASVGVSARVGKGAWELALVYLGELSRVDPLQGLHFIVLVLSIHALARGLRYDVWVRQRQVVWEVQQQRARLTFMVL